MLLPVLLLKLVELALVLSLVVFADPTVKIAGTAAEGILLYFSYRAFLDMLPGVGNLEAPLAQFDIRDDLILAAMSIWMNWGQPVT